MSVDLEERMSKEEKNMLYSTKFSDSKNEIKKLEMFSDGKSCNKTENESVADRLRNFSHIAIISCYYGKSFLSRLFRVLPKKDSQTNVIISSIGNSYEKLKAIVKDLLEVDVYQTQKLWLYVCNDISMLHTKMYLAYDKKSKADSTFCLIGSANLSDNAFKSNEEILVDVSKDDKKRAYSYFQKIKRESIDISSKNHKKYMSTDDKKQKDKIVSDIVKKIIRKDDNSKRESVFDFLNAGFLAFQSNKNFSIGFSTSKIWKSLVKDINTNLPSTLAKYSIDVADILGVRNLDYNDNEAEDNLNETGRVRPLNRFGIKKYSIETCFGYWIPRGYFLEEVKKILFPKNMNSTRVHDYQRIYSSLKKNSEKLTSPAQSKFEKLFEKIIDIKTRSIEEETRRKEVENDILQKKGSIQKELIEHIAKKKNFYEKYQLEYIRRGFYLTPMPYIWDDSSSVNDFLNSFSLGRSFNINEKSILRALNLVMDFEINEGNLHKKLKRNWNEIDKKEKEKRDKEIERRNKTIIR